MELSACPFPRSMDGTSLPLLIYGIIPGARVEHQQQPFYGLGAYISIEAMLIALGALSSRARTRRFRQEWQEAHPLQVRTYGNLKGIQAKVLLKTVDGWTNSPLRATPPASLLIGPINHVASHASLSEKQLWTSSRKAGSGSTTPSAHLLRLRSRAFHRLGQIRRR